MFFLLCIELDLLKKTGIGLFEKGKNLVGADSLG
jgi:hypothetical protein